VPPVGDAGDGGVAGAVVCDTAALVVVAASPLIAFF
jgi:hypothetical protein